MLKQKRDQEFLHIELSRPDLRNALNRELIRDLTEAFRSADKDSQVKAVIFRGEGKAFCAGADLTMMADMVQFSFEQNLLEAENLADLFEAMRLCTKPILTVAHGSVFGGGLGLLAASDMVLATDNCQFCFSEVKLGIAPAVISSFVMNRVGARANALMISGLVFESSEALRVGIVDAVVKESEIQNEISKWQKALAEAGPIALQSTKKLLQSLPGSQNPRQQTTNLIAKLRVSPEGQEGLRSFLEKRKPSWRKA